MPMTASQLCNLVCQICKAPGFTTQCGQFFNQTLEDLVLHRDLKVNRKTSTLIVPANSTGPFALEADYLRTYDMFYLVNGDPYLLDPCSPKEFDQESQQAGISSYPYEYATDLSVEAQAASASAGQLNIYPPSNGQISITHRYMVNRPDIVSPESSISVPWFADQDYLIAATAWRLMQITDDVRMEQFKADATNQLRLHLIMEGDEQQVVKHVELDPRQFRSGNWLRPTKTDPW